jgi:hypothetical protein
MNLHTPMKWGENTFRTKSEEKAKIDFSTYIQMRYKLLESIYEVKH